MGIASWVSSSSSSSVYFSRREPSHCSVNKTEQELRWTRRRFLRVAIVNARTERSVRASFFIIFGGCTLQFKGLTGSVVVAVNLRDAREQHLMLLPSSKLATSAKET
ncbi:hypothetical protein NL676_025791 [Syzygium grande]|nr:hypothetical protein NL676_025791 [Syzygium grande]